MGVELTGEILGNADSIYNLIRYGMTGGAGGSDFAGADVPYIGVNGFCSSERTGAASSPKRCGEKGYYPQF